MNTGVPQAGGRETSFVTPTWSHAASSCACSCVELFTLPTSAGCICASSSTNRSSLVCRSRSRATAPTAHAPAAGASDSPCLKGFAVSGGDAYSDRAPTSEEQRCPPTPYHGGFLLGLQPVPQAHLAVDAVGHGAGRVWCALRRVVSATRSHGSHASMTARHSRLHAYSPPSS